jgi:AcrR family transcriptional regulator
LSNPPQPAGFETRERILRAAERLFRSRGPAATSLRSITAAAGVNVAAVHYHFGGRERLAREVFVRSVAPVNEERLRRLALVERASPGPDLEGLVRALLEPVFRVAAADPSLRELGVLLLAEPKESGRELVAELFGEVMERFHRALCRSLPQLPPEELFDRLFFAVGAFVHVLVGPAVARADGSRIAPDGVALERLVRFLVAALAAPPSRPKSESA